MSYVLLHGDSGQFFKEHNMYLSQALLGDLGEAVQFSSLDAAEEAWARMTEKHEWTIWSIKTGIVLDKESKRHLLRAKKAELERQLKEMGDVWPPAC